MAIFVTIPIAIGFQNCGSPLQNPAFDEMNSKLSPGGSENGLIPRRPKGGTDTGNPDTNHNHETALIQICERMANCGIIQDSRSCWESKLETVEFINIVSGFRFESFEQYVELLDDHIWFDWEKSRSCDSQATLKYPNCSDLESVSRAIQLKLKGNSDPLSFDPDWILEIYRKHDQCRNIIFVYDDYAQ